MLLYPIHIWMVWHPHSQDSLKSKVCSVSSYKSSKKMTIYYIFRFNVYRYGVVIEPSVHYISSISQFWVTLVNNPGTLNLWGHTKDDIAQHIHPSHLLTLCNKSPLVHRQSNYYVLSYFWTRTVVSIILQITYVYLSTRKFCF